MIWLSAVADNLMHTIEDVTEPPAFGIHLLFPVESVLGHAQPFHSTRRVFKGRISGHDPLIIRCSLSYLSDGFKGSSKGILHLDDFIPRCGLLAQGSA